MILYIIPHLSLFLVRIGSDILTMSAAVFFIGSTTSRVQEVCLFAFVYYAGMFINLLVLKKYHFKAVEIKTICFYFWIFSILFSILFTQMEVLVFCRFIQGFSFSAVFYGIQDIIMLENSSQENTFGKKSNVYNNILLLNVVLSPIIGRYTFQFLPSSLSNRYIIAIIILLIAHLLLYITFNESTKRKYEEILMETPRTYVDFSKSIVLFYFFISLVIRSFLFFLAFSLGDLGWKNNNISFTILVSSLGEIISRVFFNKPSNNPKYQMQLFLILFIGCCILFSLYIKPEYKSIISVILFAMGFLQGKLGDLSLQLTKITSIEQSQASWEWNFNMQFISTLSFVIAPVFFLPFMYFFGAIQGTTFVRIIASIGSFLLLHLI